VFEFIGPEHGAQSTICAGGRYDGLIEQLGGKPTPGIGFGAGIERLIIALDDANVEVPEPEPIEIFFAVDEGAPRDRALELMARLRATDRSCETDYAGRSLRGQLTQAARLGARITVVLGSDGATIRAQGAMDIEVPFGELEERLSA